MSEHSGLLTHSAMAECGTKVDLVKESGHTPTLPWLGGQEKVAA